MGGGPEHRMEHLLIVLPLREPKTIIADLKHRYPWLTVTFFSLLKAEVDKQSDVPPEIFHPATILVTFSILPPTLKDCPKLRLIHFFSAGTNHVSSHPIYTSTDIPLTTSSGIHGPQIAEWVIMTSLVRSHSYNLLHHWQLQHRWGKSLDEKTNLRTTRDNAGQTFAVLGYGSIGRQAARLAKAMGMRVIAYTASPRTTPESKKDNGYIVPGTGDPDGSIPRAWYSGTDKASLHHFLSQDIDHLLISLPLTSSTRHLLSTEEFRILSKRNTFISNISRGQIVDQAALLSALQAYAAHAGSHTASSTKEPIHGSIENDDATHVSLMDHIPGIRGAALDVTDPEPLPPDDPLWDAPNCIITPHISGASTKYAERAFEILEINLERESRGEKMINLVDKKKGY